MLIKSIQEANTILDGVILKTPIVKADAICDGLYIKAENLQKTGAFKLRGAYYKLSRLSDQEKQRGVIAASAGNHAQGVAYACKAMQIKGTIVMPKTAPMSKIEATKSYGVDVHLVGNTFNDAYVYAKQLQEQTNATFIEPFDDYDVIAGQGTIGLEVLEKMPEVDIVFVPIGGGGLASGIACAIKELHPSCKVYGVEAKNAACMYESFQQNQMVTLDSVTTMADGIAVKKPGEHTYALCQKYLDGIVLVSEEEIAATILTLLEKMKMVGEGAGVVAVAAAMFQKVDTTGKKCVSILSGGNIDVNVISKVIDLGLFKTGRKAVLHIHVMDQPGAIREILDCLAQCNVNVVQIKHSHIDETSLSKQCNLEIVVETTSHQHIQQMKEALLKENFQFQIV